MAGLDRGEGGLTLEVLTWNLFHGRDHLPGSVESGPSWKLLGRSVPLGDHVLLNRNLAAEFAERLASERWDVALLQEVPVVWTGDLARVTGSVGRLALTSRNWMSPVTAPIWNRRPQLIGSWEGGSNLILVRRDRAVVTERTGAFTLRLRPERRRLNFLEIENGPLVFNLHASTGSARAAEDVSRAAGLADHKAAGRPVIFGGDLNVSPSVDPRLFDLLASKHGLVLPDGADASSIDQVLSSGVRVGRAERLDSGWREFRDSGTGLVARLSDHNPVIARFEL